MKTSKKKKMFCISAFLFSIYDKLTFFLLFLFPSILNCIQFYLQITTNLNTILLHLSTNCWFTLNFVFQKNKEKNSITF